MSVRPFPRPRRLARGFSLLEAIVALTIFSLCAVALFGWLAVNVQALSRVDARASQVRDGRTALAVIDTVDPMIEPAGERELPGGLVVRWKSKELAPRAAAISTTNAPLIFDVALYELEVSASRQGRETSRFNLRRAGWESVRTLGNDEF